MERRTKIVATIGPASSDPEVLAREHHAARQLVLLTEQV
jgi:pyruvate kinase